MSSRSCRFQSTLPTRGSDAHIDAERRKKRYFNPRSPRGGATLANGDFVEVSEYFNPRSPRGGATPDGNSLNMSTIISIHAPHEGERLDTSTATPLRRIFQSTLPTRGSDALSAVDDQLQRIFQSTLPTRGSDPPPPLAPPPQSISIHAPHEGERPYSRATLLLRSLDVNPRSPRGGGTT